MKLTRMAVVVAAGLLGAGLTATVAASPADEHGRASGGELVGKPLVVLAGSANWLVFVQRDPALTNEDNGKAFVRDASGDVTALPDSNGEWSFQASRDMVVGTRRPFQNSPQDWWDVRSGKHGTVRFTSNQTSLGATPDGIAYLTANHRVHRLHLAIGTRSSFKGLAYTPEYTFTTPRGLVYETKHHGDWYQRWVGSHRLTRIHIPNSVGDHSACYAGGAHYLGCWRGFDDDDANAADSVELIPLDTDGKPQISTVCAGEPAIAGNTVVWATGNTSYQKPDCAASPPTLEQLTYGSTDPAPLDVAVTGPNPRTYNAATAYGTAIFTGPNSDTIVAIAPDGTSQIIYRSSP